MKKKIMRLVAMALTAAVLVTADANVYATEVMGTTEMSETVETTEVITETESMPETEETAESEGVASTESTEENTEAETETEIETETETEIETETETEIETEKETETETETEIETETETETETEIETETETETEIETETETETEIEAETETEEIALTQMNTKGAAGSMRIYAINLGPNMGDAVLVQSGSEYLLMDIGDSTNGKTAGSYAYVKKLLNGLGVKKLSLYYSHFHGDHTGGVGNDGALDWLTSDFNVEKVYVPEASVYAGKIDYTDTYEKIERIAKADDENTKIVYLKVGSTFTFGGASVEIIGPVGVSGYTNPGTPSGDAGVDEDGAYDDFINNCSLVARVTCGNTTYLTAGDAKTEAEDALIKKYGTTGKLNADIYKLSHHGIAPANSEKFMSYITPVCSFGMNGGYTKLESYGDGDNQRRMTYSSKMNASKYGLCYMVADEQDTFVVDVNNSLLNMYRYSAMQNPLKGIVKTVGSYGISYDSKNLTTDFYDYYYLGDNGKPITGLQTVSVEGVKGLRYFESGGRMYAGTWGYDDTKFVYKPWVQVGNDWQYYDQSTAIVATGWKTIDGDTYYFDNTTGYRFVGLKTISGGVYRFTDGGKLCKNEWYNDTSNNNASHWMYFGSDGKRTGGWAKIEGDTYYLDAKTGYRAVGIKTIDSAVYRFTDGGKLFKNGWYNSSSKKDAKCWMYFGSDGKRITGWKTLEGEKFYFDKKTGCRVIGLQTIDSVMYRFTDGGKLFKNGWYNSSASGKNKKYWMYFGKDGKCLTGWQTIGKDKFYFDKKTGRRAVGVKTISGAVYRFTDGGKLCVNSWYNDSKSGKDENHWMYFGKNGKRVTKWQTISKEKYYLDSKTGYRVTGLTKIGSKYYYFSPGGKLQKSKTVKIDGYKCKIDKKGVWKNLPSPSATKITSLKSSSKKKAVVKWQKKSITGYEIYMATSKKGKYEKVTRVKKAKTTSYTKSSLKSGKKYYFKVRTYTQVGDYKFYSKYSSVKSIKVK